MHWSKEDLDYLIDNYPKQILLSEILNKLNRSKRAVLHKAARMGLSRQRVPYNKPKDPNYRKITDKRYYEKNKNNIYRKKKERQFKYKSEFIALMGGKCSRCGYSKSIAALDFHHSKDIKEGAIAVMLNSASKQKILKEIEKCILLCANCHRELHYSKAP